MTAQNPAFSVRLAANPQDVAAAQQLRYAVFVEELDGDGPLVDHQTRREVDRFDTFADHLLLWDGNVLAGVYRLMDANAAGQAGGFYSASEFDLTPLLKTGRKLLELGRSCLHPDYRGGTAMFHLWNGLAAHVNARGYEVMFGVASFPGTDPAEIAVPLAYLQKHHLAPPELRVTARPPQAGMPDRLPLDTIDRRAAMVQTPALIKAYLRLGGVVGQGAYIDHRFNTIDVCLVLDTASLNARQKRIYDGTAP